jgi:ribose transport system permease protein
MQGSRNLLQRILRIDEIGVIVALLLMCLYLKFQTPNFLVTDNLLQVMRQASYYGLMAVGMVFVLSMGEVDLSVGSIFTLVTIVGASELEKGHGVGAAIGLGLLVGLGCGFMNGLLSLVLRIPTIIVTLGTLSMYRGLALVHANGGEVRKFERTGAFFDNGTQIGPIHTSVIVMLAVAALGYVLFHHTPFGVRVQAIGSNLQAARYSGISVVRHKLLVMTLMGLIAGIAGLTSLAFLKSGDPNGGQGMELFVIASAIIGGTSLSGGSGSIIGGILGALTIAVIRNGLLLLNTPIYWSVFATGAVIVGAVAISVLIKRGRT